MEKVKGYAALEKGAKLTAYEYSFSALKPDEVEIDVEFCGICHSDISMIQNEWGISTYPLVPGHEVTGKVAAVGSAVTKFKKGDYVGSGWHSRYCMTCTQCLGGDHNLCGSAGSMLSGLPGGFSEKMRASEVSVLHLPPGLEKGSAGPLFCAGITVFTPLMHHQIKPTDRVAVIGVGGLGHLAIQFLKAWGCEVTAFLYQDSEKEGAMKLGAHKTIVTSDKKGIEAAANSFDLVISTINVQLDWNLFVGTLRHKGRLHFLGVLVDPVPVQVMPLIFKQASISSSLVGSPSNIEKMLEFAVRHKIQPVVEYFPFNQVNEAIDRLKSGKARYRVVLKK